VIQRAAFAVLLCMAAATVLMRPAARRRVVRLPRGIVYLKSEMAVEGGTELRGAPGGSVLRFGPEFAGRALIVVKGADVVLRDFRIEGDRGSDVRSGLPPYDTPFVRFTRGNGILAEGVSGLRIENVRFSEMAGFAVLASGARDIVIDRVQVRDSGSRNAAGRNNATGGILLEEGTRDFQVTRCEFTNIRGNGIWTHSLYTSPRNANGLIAQNRLSVIGRDAIQVGHATGVRVIENAGRAIGFPIDTVDVEGRAVPVAMDTAGNVEQCSYTGNRFEEIDGKCIDLDGFHDGEIRGNVCVNRAPAEKYRFGNYGIVMNNSNPDMQSRNIRVVDNLIESPLYGGIFVIGTGHRIAGNRLLNLDTAHCGCSYSTSDPDILSSGIYLGRGAERPDVARGNVIEDNEIQGFQMKTRCIVNAPGISPGWNTVRGNRCRQ
jgi:hypothetical protein